MKKQFVVVPEGWPCSVEDCPPGLFVCDDRLCLKTNHLTNGPYCCGTGEIFWGGTGNEEDRQTLQVQPVVAVWEAMD